MSKPPTPVNQAFLVGPTLYLRLAEPEDASTAAIWRTQPFPAPAEVVKEQLEEMLAGDPEELEADQLFLICRRKDDRPVGSLHVEMDDWRFADVNFSIDRLAPAAERDAVMAEAVDILLPWLIEERHLMSVLVFVAGHHPETRRRIEALGGREQFVHRELCLFDGQRQDMTGYQVYNPVWVEKIGMPPAPVMGPVEREIRSPARPPVKLGIEDRPPEAIVVGERLYLRPVRPEEGKLVARWTREETEVYYPEGRLLFNAHTFAEAHKSMAKKEPPTYLRFAIVLRETDEMIGCNGLESISWVHRYAETETEIYRPEHRNAGYGSEAKHLLLEYAFDRIGLHAVISYVAETNPRSANALRKQGYRDAGTVEWDSFCASGLCKYFTFDYLASEWRAARDRQQST